MPNTRRIKANVVDKHTYLNNINIPDDVTMRIQKKTHDPHVLTWHHNIKPWEKRSRTSRCKHNRSHMLHVLQRREIGWIVVCECVWYKSQQSHDCESKSSATAWQPNKNYKTACGALSLAPTAICLWMLWPQSCVPTIPIQQRTVNN